MRNIAFLSTFKYNYFLINRYILYIIYKPFFFVHIQTRGYTPLILAKFMAKFSKKKVMGVYKAVILRQEYLLLGLFS